MRKKISTLTILMCMLAVCLFGIVACQNEQTEKYKVNFMVENAVYATVDTVGEESIILPGEPQKSGYDFAGWYRDEDSRERPFTKDSLLEEKLSSDISVYAAWDAKTNILHFDGNGATSGEMSDMQIKTAETANLTANLFVREGYDFAGWSTQSSGAVEYQDGGSYTMGTDASYTLYAVWEAKEYAITYENTKDAQNSNPAVYTIESDTITLAPLTTDGYTFEGWYMGEDEVTEIVKGSFGEKTFTAKWTEVPYEITYNLYEGTNSESNPTVFTISDLPLALEEPTKAGFTFLGWYTSPDFGGEAVAEITKTGNIELYARFVYAANGVFEDFEGKTIEQVSPKWNIQGQATPSLKATDGNNELKFYATGDFTIQANGYNIGDFDLSQANGFRMKIRINPAKAATVVVKIGSYLNAYTMEKNFYDQNTSVYMVCDFAGMKLADDGSTGELDKTKINFLQISVKNFTAPLDVYIDELEFYTDENGAMGSAFVSDFSDESTQDWGSAVIENGTATVSHATAASLQYRNASWVNYQNTYAIRFKVTTENVKSISARVLDSNSNGIKKAVSFTQDGEYEYILYYNQMEMHGTKPHASMKFYFIQFYIEFNEGGGSAQFSSVELLIG